MIPDKLKETQVFLYELLSEKASPAGLQWLDKKIQSYRQQPSDRSFYLTFGSIPRFIEKELLHPSTEQLAKANTVRTGFNPTLWTIDQVARIWLLLQLPTGDPDWFVEKIETLFGTADMREQEVLYASLPLLPFPDRFVARASEGLRTNITSVFDAIALDNPYPADYMEEAAWNQLVLKAVFMARPIYRIYGMEKRANPKLARIISDYAHERWAAGRVVSPEFWRPVGPFLNDALLADVQRLLNEENPLQQQAAALVCHDSDLPAAKALLTRYPQLKAAIEKGELTWNTLALDWWKEEMV